VRYGFATSAGRTAKLTSCKIVASSVAWIRRRVLRVLSSAIVERSHARRQRRRIQTQRVLALAHVTVMAGSPAVARSAGP